ncbi:hypothetical protein [Neptunomonas antarctica]|uniref:Uncharacterized protein n=1 Tax=Neptunomonas antarctica TaxID=619304 RepID=A0A1N7L5B2_9GAMM|nr:hypothetical protein [Neptunomonas antarctica]SIS69055.1 hypothetical protein SAMN05421760_103247 [Neptunomonas antarctica]
MKIQRAIELFQSGALDRVEIRRNPSDREQWFVMIIGVDARPLMIADENDKAVVSQNLEEILTILKTIGFSSSEVFF